MVTICKLLFLFIHNKLYALNSCTTSQYFSTTTNSIRFDYHPSICFQIIILLWNLLNFVPHRKANISVVYVLDLYNEYKSLMLLSVYYSCFHSLLLCVVIRSISLLLQFSCFAFSCGILLNQSATPVFILFCFVWSFAQSVCYSSFHALLFRVVICSISLLLQFSCFAFSCDNLLTQSATPFFMLCFFVW